MSIAQTVLVFVGIPAGVVAVFAALIFGRSELRQANRYRPGKPWNFPPVWYVPHPEALQPAAGERRAALSATKRAAIESGQAPTPSAVGGASGEW
jgi:hypothetical protein